MSVSAFSPCVPAKRWSPTRCRRGCPPRRPPPRTALLVEAERRGLAAHPHRPALRRRSRIDPQRHPHGRAVPLGSSGDAEQLLAVLEVDFTDAAADHPVEIGRRLARPGEQDSLGGDAGPHGRVELRARGDLGPGPFLVKNADHRRVGVGLDRVIDLGEARDRRPKRAVGPAQQIRVVDEERRAVGVGEFGQRQAADLQETRGVAGKILGDQRAGEIGRRGGGLSHRRGSPPPRARR